MTSFRYAARGYKKTIVLLPGWACDYRIFDTLDIPFNYLLPVSFSPLDLTQGLLTALKENRIAKISLFGWSLGGFAAQEFGLGHPALIEEIILVGMRPEYEAEGLDEIKRRLLKNRKGYLYKFYAECFSTAEEKAYFRRRLMRAYCRELALKGLLEGLDYLRQARLDTKQLGGIRKIKFIHGRDDLVAPLGAALRLKDELPAAEFICVEDAGHAPFLRKDFRAFL